MKRLMKLAVSKLQSLLKAEVAFIGMEAHTKGIIHGFYLGWIVLLVWLHILLSVH